MIFQFGITLPIFIIFITSYSIKGIPQKRSYDQSNIELNNEKRYPNGTIIGKYTCRDKDGNPVHIKYYADDSSYGVELNSFKVLTLNNEMKTDNKPKLNKNLSNAAFPFDEINDTINTLSKELHKNKSYNKNYIPNDNKSKKNEIKPKTDGYETFFEKEMKPLDKYNNDKIRIYYNGNKRKIRSTKQSTPFMFF